MERLWSLQWNLATSLVALKEYTEAEALLREVIEDGKRDCGAEFPGIYQGSSPSPQIWQMSWRRRGGSTKLC